MIDELARLKGILLNSLNRCEHCHGEPFWCAECEWDKAQFLGTVVDILIKIEPDECRRVLLAVELLP